jgi:hypothetical protein
MALVFTCDINAVGKIHNELFRQARQYLADIRAK